jgi:hypothetical protein
MPRFNIKVKVYALDERAKGEGWQVIRQGIREKFDVEPPTVRAMQKWEKKLDRLELSHQLMKEVKAQMPAIEAEAEVRFARDLLPVLWQAGDAGQEIELAGWKWFLSVVEKKLGSSKFDQLIQSYMEGRGKGES